MESKYTLCKIGDLVTFQNGYAFKSSEFILDGNCKVIKIKELKDGKVRFFDDTATIDYKDEYKAFVINKNDILFALTGDPVNKPNPLSWVGRVSVYDNETPALLNRRVCKVICSDKINSYYLYYYFRQQGVFYSLAAKATGSASQANISTKTIADTYILLPCLDEQKKIVSILNALDNKIKLNNEINSNLEQQASALYSEYFSSKITQDCEAATLDEFCEIFTGRKNSNASVPNGKYKFFTCSPEPLLIDSHIYDGNAIIVSGNGAYTGRTRFYSGKFDLYQRTYACTLKQHLNDDYIFPLYWFVKLELSKKIMGGTRGSAIPYIVMNDLAKFEFGFDKVKFEQYMPVFKTITETIQANENENERLASIRDTLLLKLMSGEIDLSSVSI